MVTYIFGLHPIQILLIISIAFLIIPIIVIFRFYDPRKNYEVEFLKMKEGYIVHTQEKMKGQSIIDLKLTDGLYKDKLKRKKYLYYFLWGIQARYLVLFNQEDKLMRFKSAKIPSSILKIARDTDILERGMEKQFKGKDSFKTIIILGIILMVIILAVSYLQSGGLKL
jgi:hypothetical protein